MRTGSPEYDVEPDGLDLDAMFQRLTYRVTVGVPGPGAAAAIGRARRRRVARAGVAATLAVAGIAGALVVAANVFLVGRPGSPIGPAQPAPTATLPNTFETQEPGTPSGSIPDDLMLTQADIPFEVDPTPPPYTLTPLLEQTRAQACGVRALGPITGPEKAVLLGVGGLAGEIEQYVREVGDQVNAEGWTFGARSELDWCLEMEGSAVPDYRLTIRPLGTVSTAGYTVTLRLALTTAPDQDPGIHFYAVGRAGTLVTAIRYDLTGADPEPFVAGFKALVTTGMERLAAAR